MPRDLRTQAIVLRRTNYSESDRILSLLTPDGKISALAKGVRKERSKLAGGIEIFSVSDIVVHQGKGELGILTSARMLKFYRNIMTDINALELASEILRQIDRATEQTNSPEYFEILKQVLAGLDYNLAQAKTDAEERRMEAASDDLPISGQTTLAPAVFQELTRTWFLLNFAKINGEEINLVRDVSGEKLQIDEKYIWDVSENALRLNPQGNIGANEIKTARFLLANPLAWATKIANLADYLPTVLVIAKCINKTKNG